MPLFTQLPFLTHSLSSSRCDAGSGSRSAASPCRETYSEPKPTDEAPDGGIAAWSVVLGAWCVLFCSFGWINSIGTFQSYYETDMLKQYSASTIAWIPSLQIFFMYAMGPIPGYVFDHYGPRHLLVIGSLLHVFGLMMASISTQYYQLLLSQGVVSAIGVSLIFQPANSVIPSWFDKKRGAAYGIMTSGSSIGGVVFPIMIQRLIPLVGFGWAMRAAAFLILALLLVANLTIRSRLPPAPHNLGPDALVQPFKDVEMMLLTFGFLLLTFGIFIPINFLVVEAVAAGGVSPDLAQYLIAIFNAGSLFGRLGAGASADFFGPYNVFVAVCYLAGILILALWIPASTTAAIIVFAVLFGFSSGAYVALAAPCVVRISPFQQIGYRVGLIFLFSSIAGLTTNPIAGAILAASNGSWLGVKVYAGVLVLAGTTLALGARVHRTGPKFMAVF
ncbi:putative monocarboxylate protein [Diplogelasinospora grovesii]|uniref:Monocarboxylate protein n=1 Tax=Diplogelasinospora grovesii TaxID=303347 RepID=A0AAN6N560_9PEZI|nr:putative monocarboxylate protein [Diplogelasinospora grovesii]